LRGAESDDDEKFVKKICEKRGITCLIGGAEEKNKYKNEAEAREARYSFFQKILEEGSANKIALAHHLNDFAETMVLRLIRGTGLRGLRSIPALRGNFVRPILILSRTEIIRYLKENDLPFCTDSTNSDLVYSRNFVRHKVIPLFETLNPSVVESLGKAGRLIATDYDFLEKSAKDYLDKIILEENDENIILSYPLWQKLHPSIQNLVLRLSIEKITDLADLSAMQLLEIVDMLNKGCGNKKKILPRSLHIELGSGKIMLFKK